MVSYLSDPRQWVAGIIYFTAFYFIFNVPLRPSLMIATAVVVCWSVGFGCHWIMNSGIALMLLAFTVWLGWLPDPSGWAAHIGAIF